MTTMSRRERVAVFGHFGAGNFGNEGTLEAMLYNLRRWSPDVEITCVCTVPEKVAADYNLTATKISDVVIGPWRVSNLFARLFRKLLVGIPIECYRWFRAMVTLSRMDALIVPGTGLLTDAYSLVGWGPYNTFKWSVIAKLCRCRLLFVSVGAGPLYSRLGKYLVKGALSLADFRSYRDISTLRYLENIGLRSEADRVYPDLAFSLATLRLPKGGTESKPRRVVGLGLMEYAGRYSVAEPSNEIYSAYLDNLAIFVGWLLDHNYDVRLLIGDLTDKSVVLEFKDILSARLVNYDAERIIDQVVSSVDQLLLQVASTDVVIGTRFHNVIMAMLLGKPVISISFHHKCTSLMSQMGLSEYCLDINSFSYGCLIETFCMLEENIETLKLKIIDEAQKRREALEEQYKIIFDRILPA